MADDPSNPDPDDEAGNENSNLKHMREKAKRTDEAEARAEQLARENAMLRAGVDTDTAAGRMFHRAYDGDLDDVEAIRTAAQEVGALRASAEPASEGAEGDAGPEGNEPENNGTQERRALADGAPADTGEKKDPRESGRELYDGAVAKGAPWEEAAGGFLNHLAAAAQDGDPRVIYADR